MEFGLDHDVDDDGRESSINSQSQQSRGRPRIPERWSRVVNVDSTMVYAMKVFQLSSDLLVAQGLQLHTQSQSKVKWVPAFCPKLFVTNRESIGLADYEMVVEELRTYGRHVTHLRRWYQQRAIDQVTTATSAALVASAS